MNSDEASELKVTVVVGGRWHAFDLAQGLKARGVLHRLVTNYPWFKVRRWGFDRHEVVCLPASQWLNQIVYRMCPERWRTRSQSLVHRVFATAAARHLDGATLVHGWSGFSEASISYAHAARHPFVLERGSSHMLTQCRLLAEEGAAVDVAAPQTHPGVVAMELREYAAATCVMVPSRFAERSFLANGFPAERLVRNPLGVNLGQFTPGTVMTDNLPFRVIYAGALNFRKGVHHLVESFRTAAIAEAKLTLVGGASAETDRLISAPPVGLERIGHVPQSELQKIYRQASVFAIASIEDGWGMVLGQALACGLPLVCTENTGGEDLLEMLSGGVAPVAEAHGVRRYPAGFVVPIRSPQAIAHCLRRLHENRELLRAQRAAALRIHELKLDWQAYADRAIHVYRELSQRAH